MASTISHLHPSPHRSIVRVTGELDLVTAPLLRAVLNSADADPMHEFVVEFSGVTFMDCSGLAPLLEAHAKLGGRLRLRDPSQAVSNLLCLVGLGATFAIDETTPAVRAEATAATAEDLARPRDDPGRARPPGTPVDEKVPVHAGVEHAGLGVLEVHITGPGEAIGNRIVIEQARGMLMASLGCDVTQASHALLQISWDQEVAVLDAALALVAAAQDSRLQTKVTESAATDTGRATRDGAMVASRLGTDTV